MHLGGKSSGPSSLFSLVPFLSLHLIFVPFMSWFHTPLYLFVAQWLRHFATNLKVVGSIPNGVIGIFH
jgi:hypothetical protein